MTVANFCLSLGKLQSGALARWLPVLNRVCKVPLDYPLCIVGGDGSGGRERWLPIVMPQLLRQWEGAVIEINLMDDFRHVIVKREILNAIVGSPRATFCGFISPAFDAITTIDDDPAYGYYPRGGSENIYERQERLRSVIASGGYVELGGVSFGRLSTYGHKLVTQDLCVLVGLIAEESDGSSPVVVVTLSKFAQAPGFLSQLMCLSETQRIALVILAEETDGFAALNPDNCYWVLGTQCVDPLPHDIPSVTTPRLTGIGFEAFFWSPGARAFHPFQSIF